MLNDIGSAQLIKEILLISIFPIIGALLIVATKNGWNWLLNLKLEWLCPKLLEKNQEAAAYYLIGVLFIIMGMILIVQRLLVLGGLLPDSAVTVSILKERRPLSARESHLSTVLTTIVIYLNILCASMWFLIGVHRRWFLKGEPPRWIRSIFENNRAVAFLHFIFGIIALFSAVMVAPFIRELGHGLGYW
jgi:hypothetical protein